MKPLRYLLWGILHIDQLLNEHEQIVSLGRDLARVERLHAALPPALTAQNLVQSILGRPINWVNWRALPNSTRKAWRASAKECLNNQAFIALCGKTIDGEVSNGELVKDLLEFAAKDAVSFTQVQDMRMTINGIQLIREKLEEMRFEEPSESIETINDPL